MVRTDKLRPRGHHVGDGDGCGIHFRVLVGDGVGQGIANADALFRNLTGNLLARDIGGGAVGNVRLVVANLNVSGVCHIATTSSVQHSYLEGNGACRIRTSVVDGPGDRAITLGTTILCTHKLRPSGHIVGDGDGGSGGFTVHLCVIDPVDGVGQDVTHTGDFTVGIDAVGITFSASLNGLGVLAGGGGVGEDDAVVCIRPKVNPIIAFCRFGCHTFNGCSQGIRSGILDNVDSHLVRSSIVGDTLVRASICRFFNEEGIGVRLVKGNGAKVALLFIGHGVIPCEEISNVLEERCHQALFHIGRGVGNGQSVGQVYGSLSNGGIRKFIRTFNGKLEGIAFLPGPAGQVFGDGDVFVRSTAAQGGGGEGVGEGGGIHRLVVTIFDDCLSSQRSCIVITHCDFYAIRCRIFCNAVRCYSIFCDGVGICASLVIGD